MNTEEVNELFSHFWSRNREGVTWILDQNPDDLIKILNFWKNKDIAEQSEWIKKLHNGRMEHYPATVIKFLLNEHLKGKGLFRFHAGYTYTMEIVSVFKEETRINFTTQVSFYKDGNLAFAISVLWEDFELFGESEEKLTACIRELLENPSVYTSRSNILNHQAIDWACTDGEVLRKIADVFARVQDMVDVAFEEPINVWKSLLVLVSKHLKENTDNHMGVPKHITDFLDHIHAVDPRVVYVDHEGYVIPATDKKGSNAIVLERYADGIVRERDAHCDVYNRYLLMRKLVS